MRHWGPYAHVYVAEFDDGCIKVGATHNPKNRRTQLNGRLPIGVVKRTRFEVVGKSMLWGDAVAAEQSLIAQLAGISERRVKIEWFYGPEFLTVLELAARAVEDAIAASPYGYKWGHR